MRTVLNLYVGVMYFIRSDTPKGNVKRMAKRVTVTRESDSGRNERFRDNSTGREMSRSEFVREIERGNYGNYHVRDINGVPTPVSDPDRSERNNLG